MNRRNFLKTISILTTSATLGYLNSRNKSGKLIERKSTETNKRIFLYTSQKNETVIGFILYSFNLHATIPHKLIILSCGDSIQYTYNSLENSIITGYSVVRL